MKKLIALALIGWMTIPAFSQQINTTPQEQPAKTKPSAEDRAKRKSEHLARELQLTEEQKPLVYAELLRSLKKSDEIRAKYNNDTSSDAMKNELTAARKEHRVAMEGILTPEQQKKLVAKRKDRKERAKQAGKDLNEVDDY